MTRRLSVLLFFVFASFSVFPQVTKKETKKIARPDIPGSFFVDLGLTRAAHAPANFKQGLWGSRTLNVYYQYPVRLLKSKFSFNPGIGFGFDRFKLTNQYTLDQRSDGTGAYQLVLASSLVSQGAIHKSQIINDYIDFPMDFRYDTKPEDRTRSFSITLGGRFGLLVDNFTKLKYNLDNQNKTLKDKQSHGINPYRYGVYARVGAGGFNWFVQYNISPYFTTNKGPDQTKMNTLTIGISIGGL